MLDSPVQKGILKKIPSRLSFRENLHSEEEITKVKSGGTLDSDENFDLDSDDDYIPKKPIKTAIIEKQNSSSHGSAVSKRSFSQSPARKRSEADLTKGSIPSTSPIKGRYKAPKTKDMSDGELVVSDSAFKRASLPLYIYTCSESFSFVS